MIDSQAFERAELGSALRQLRSFAQAGPPAAEHASSALLHFSTAVSGFVSAFENDPDADPAELLVAAGEAHAHLEAVQRCFDCAMDQLERLSFKLDATAPPAPDAPEQPRPERDDVET